MLLRTRNESPRDNSDIRQCRRTSTPLPTAWPASQNSAKSATMDVATPEPTHISALTLNGTVSRVGSSPPPLCGVDPDSGSNRSMVYATAHPTSVPARRRQNPATRGYVDSRWTRLAVLSAGAIEVHHPPNLGGGRIDGFEITVRKCLLLRSVPNTFFELS